MVTILFPADVAPIRLYWVPAICRLRSQSTIMRGPFLRIYLITKWSCKTRQSVFHIHFVSYNCPVKDTFPEIVLVSDHEVLKLVLLLTYTKKRVTLVLEVKLPTSFHLTVTLVAAKAVASMLSRSTLFTRHNSWHQNFLFLISFSLATFFYACTS